MFFYFAGDWTDRHLFPCYCTVQSKYTAISLCSGLANRKQLQLDLIILLIGFLFSISGFFFLISGFSATSKRKKLLLVAFIIGSLISIGGILLLIGVSKVTTGNNNTLVWLFSPIVY